MADRSVVVSLKVEMAQYKSAMADAASSARKAASDTENAFKNTGQAGASGAKDTASAWKEAGSEAGSSADGVKAPWDSAGEAAKQSADGVGEAYKEAGTDAQSAADGVKAPWDEAGSSAKESADGVGNAYKEAGTEAESAADGVKPSWDEAGNTAEQSADGVGQAYKEAGTEAQSAAEQVREPWNEAGNVAEQSADGVGQAYVEAGQEAGQSANGVEAPWQAAGEAAQHSSDGVGESWTEAGTAAEGAAAKTQSAWSNMSSSVGGALNGVIEKQRAHSAEWDKVSTAATVGGAAVVGAVGMMVKSASDWQSAWTGVLKTVDGTPEQLAAVEAGLRGMSRELPASHKEIAAVAEAAGQLGVETDNVVAFTRTMIDMGESTNLSADDAATSIARFTNIMGTVGEVGESAYSRVGSAMVDLGNNFATTESEINAMSLRIAGAGKQMGMTEGDVMGLATAMSSVGIHAEAGGTAISQSMKKIDNAVRDGGEGLDKFAKVAGSSADEFANKWRSNPSQALDEFVQGLGKVQDSGGSVSGTLDDLGIKGLREQDTFLRLAGASDILSSALETGNKAFDENSALAEEAGLRYETAESRIKIAWNSIQDAAITAGSAILPVVAQVADVVATMAQAFSQIPAPVAGAIAAIAGIGGAALLMVGGAMKAVKTISELKLALETLGLARAAAGIGGMVGTLGAYAGAAKSAASQTGLLTKSISAAKFGLGGLAIGLAAISIGGHITETAAIGFDKLSKSIDRSGSSIQKLDFQFKNAEWAELQGGINGVGDAVSKLGEGSKWEEWNAGLAKFLGYNNSWEQMKNDVSSVDEALAGLVSSGDFEGAAKNFEKITESARKSGVEGDKLVEMFPKLASAVQEYADSQGVSLSKSEQLDAMMGKMPPKLAEAAGGAEQAAQGIAQLGDESEETADSLSDIVDALQVLGEINMTAAEATGAYHDKLRSLNEALQANTFAFNEQTGMLDTTTEGGYKAQQAFDELARAGWDNVEAMSAQGASNEQVQGTLRGMYDDLVNNATQFGLTGDQAEKLARSVLGIPDDVSVESWMSNAAEQVAQSTKDKVDNIPAQKSVEITADDRGSTAAVQAKVDSIHGKTPEVMVTDKGTSQLTQGQIDAIRGKTTKVEVTDQGTVYYTQGKIDGVTDGDAKILVTENGVAAVQQSIDSIRGKQIEISVLEKHYKEGMSLANPSLHGGATGGSVGAIASGQAGTTIRGFAGGGGLVPGVPPSNPMRDNRLAHVTDTGETIAVRSREFIMNEDATRRNRGLLEWLNSGGVAPSGRGFAGGGSPYAAMSGKRGFNSPGYGPSDIATAVSSAMSGIVPVVSIGGRKFYGLMEDTKRAYGNRS